MDPLPSALAKSPQRGRPAETVTTHLANALDAAGALQRRVGRIDLAEVQTSGQFWTSVRLADLTHDAGKVAIGFQDMVHGRTRRWGHRHELVSLGFLPGLIADSDLRMWVATGVITHHRPLTGGHRSLSHLYGGLGAVELSDQIGEIPHGDVVKLGLWLAATARRAGLSVEDGQVLASIANTAHVLLQEVLNHWDRPLFDADLGLTAVLLQGAVTLADHLSSAHGVLRTEQPLDARFPPALFTRWESQGRKPQGFQMEAMDTDGHLLVRAPTGSGKTEAGLLWAAGQAVNIAETTGGVPRVFFALPYLASINAMAARLGTLLKDCHIGDADLVGVSHSRAASFHLKTAISSEDGDADSQDDDEDSRQVKAAHKAVSRAAATRLFRETLRIATPYQLLRGALAGPAHSSILIDAANSVFVLDELHAYDPRRLGYILASARLWERLGGRIAVLSATLPTALATLLTETLDGDVRLLDASALDLPCRHRLGLRSHQLTDASAVEEMKQRLLDRQAVLVVANNVASAQHLFDELAPLARELYGEGAAMLLHARFKRGDRSDIEGRIGERFRTRRTPRLPGLLVATQTVEVSLDVDFDVLFTSAAPLEALLQRFGRVNRVAERTPADVIVHAATYAPRGKKDPQEYADGVYLREPVELGWQTLTRHDDAIVDERHAAEWLDEVYGSPWGHRWGREVRARRDEFTSAFLEFDHPFDDRSPLAEMFDSLFEGTEAILQDDVDAYTASLSMADGQAGKLLAEEYLIPMPYWAARLTQYERKFDVRIIDGDYDSERGLLTVRGPAAQVYQAGTVL
uniref:CRISPR-associated helicase/endonuclease Cas3 n=1 Tax=Nonomuraea pusilla TaxID=46177 RepID=UPI0006E46E0C|nr:CRISPR-associated helicase/endonuclease Cas3 [Nonomuraea pusilla]